MSLKENDNYYESKHEANIEKGNKNVNKVRKTYSIVSKGNRTKIGSFDKMHVIQVPGESHKSFKKRVGYFSGDRKSVGGKGSYYEKVLNKHKIK